MSIVVRILLSALTGSLACGVLSFAMAFLVMIFDNVKLIEAFAYGLVVGVLAGLIGLVIGFAIGVGNFGVIGGAVIGILGTLLGVTVLTITATDDPRQYLYFLKASGIFSIHFYVPTALAGIVTVLIMKRIYKA